MQRQRMKELIGLLNNACLVYEQGEDEIMSNKEYDKLYDELVLLENTTGIVLENSPTQQVGYEVVSSLKKVKHPNKMLSLNKTKDTADLKKFLGDKMGLLTWKLDGLTVLLNYNYGCLISAVTRGNGEVGEDITHNARQFKNVPQTIEYKGELVLRGEAVISYETFHKINSKLHPDEQYKNPRNLVSGTVRQLDSKVCAEREVEWICFEVVEGLQELKSIELEGKQNLLCQVERLGFDSVYSSAIKSNRLEWVMQNFYIVNEYKYPVDGLVLTFNDIDYSKSLGTTSHHPLHSIAFKWQDETYESTLLDVEWNVGRTGVITPTAIFKPVEIDGSTVERASLHNLDILGGLELGIGDTITVYKANKIIPQIDDNLTRSNTLEIPQNCPCCGQKTAIIKQNSAILVCENPNCKQKLLARFENFVSRDCMNIVGLSSATLEMFIDKGWIKEFADLYENDFMVCDLDKEKGWSSKSVQKLLDSIASSRKCTLAQFITSLGIDGVGKSQAKILAKAFKDVKHYTGASYNELIALDGIGDVTARAILDYWSENYESMEALVRQLNIQPVEEIAAIASNSISGKTFVITGSVNHYDNRKALQAEIEALGGKVSGSVSKATDYLINNDSASTTGKNKKALELGIPIITEEDYILLKNQ